LAALDYHHADERRDVVLKEIGSLAIGEPGISFDVVDCYGFAAPVGSE
jgi:hypothetical protein